MSSMTPRRSCEQRECGVQCGYLLVSRSILERRNLIDGEAAYFFIEATCRVQALIVEYYGYAICSLLNVELHHVVDLLCREPDRCQ